MQSGVSDDGEILDFFSDIPLNISNFFNSLELEDDLSNFQSYLRDISDFENYTAKKIDDIFRDVINVDETYATIFRDFNDRMTDFGEWQNALRCHLPCQFHHLRRNDEIGVDVMLWYGYTIIDIRYFSSGSCIYINGFFFLQSIITC